VGAGHGGLAVRPGAYSAQHGEWTVPADGGTHEWLLAPTHGRHDLVLRGPEGWERRIAGCVAGAWPAISDPALGVVPPIGI
jgi:phospholipase C